MLDPELKGDLDTLKKEMGEVAENTNPRAILSFRNGLLYGLGATVGLALLFSLITFIVSRFGGLPVIGHFLVSIGSFFHR